MTTSMWIVIRMPIWMMTSMNIFIYDDYTKVWERSFLVTHAEGFVSKGELQLVRADCKLTHSWYTGGQSII